MDDFLQAEGAQAESTTVVSIPVSLYKRIEKLIEKKEEFDSISDYVTYVLREVVSSQETKEMPAPFTSTNVEEIKARL